MTDEEIEEALKSGKLARLRQMLENVCKTHYPGTKIHVDKYCGEWRAQIVNRYVPHYGSAEVTMASQPGQDIESVLLSLSRVLQLELRMRLLRLQVDVDTIAYTIEETRRT